MATAFRKYDRLPATVDAAYYDGSQKSRNELIARITKLRGVAFPASELLYRHEIGTYFHQEHGFIYVPQGARRPGSPIEQLRDDELIVRTDSGVFAVVFPGDYIVRRRSGFYPLASESFDRGHRPRVRRGITIPAVSPAS